MVYTHYCPCSCLRGGEGRGGEERGREGRGVKRRGGEGRGGVLVHPTTESGRVEVALRGEGRGGYM